MKREVRKRTKNGGKKFNIFPCRQKNNGKICTTKTRWRLCVVDDAGEVTAMAAVCPACLQRLGLWEGRVRDGDR